MVRASIDDPEYVRELREELIAEAADPEVVCESCGNVQADMGRGVACEGCGEGPMPTADGDGARDRITHRERPLDRDRDALRQVTASTGRAAPDDDHVDTSRATTTQE